MKLLTLAVAGVVALLTGVTIWVGARVREPTVVAHPYEEGLAYVQQGRAMAAGGGGRGSAPAPSAPSACDLGAGPCAVPLDGVGLTLEVGPRPLHTLRELTVEVRQAGDAPPDGVQLEVSFAMQGMHMGDNRVRLAPAGEGRYRGTAVLVRCPSGRRDWIATVRMRQGEREQRAALPLTVSE